MSVPAILADPEAGLAHAAAELVRRVQTFGANDAVACALAEFRARGANPSHAAIARARVEARTAADARLAIEKACHPLRSIKTKTPTSAVPPGPVAKSYGAPQTNPATGVLDLRRVLRSITFDPGATIEPPRWLVRGLLPEAGVALVYGESSTGKSFMTAELTVAVIHGGPFFDRRVRAGSVAYIAAEGGGRFGVRLKAAWESDRWSGYRRARSLVTSGDALAATGGIEIITEAPDLSPNGNRAVLVHTVERAFANAADEAPLRLVVLDTLHASMGGGDENSGADMGAVLAPLRDIAERLGLLVLIVHHPGKDSTRGPRGSGSLLAAMDTVIQLETPGVEGNKARSGARRLATVTKARDGQDGATFEFNLDVVEMGIDDEGEPFNSCIVQPIWPDAADKAARAASGNPNARLLVSDRKALEIIRRMAVDGRSRADGARETFVTEALERDPEGKRDSITKAWRRALTTLEKVGLVGTSADENAIYLKDQTCDPDTGRTGHTL